jgi:RNA polymerase sigma-70 factor (ECF subfamily)
VADRDSMGVMVHPLAPRVEELDRPFDFDAWMRAEQKRVFLICRRMLREIDEADMATQDVFLKAFKVLSAPGGGGIDDPSKWVTRVAMNTCLDRLRSRAWQFWRKRPSQEDESTILSLAAGTGPTAEDRVFAGEIGERLASALDRLSARQRAVFTLRHYEDLSLEQIGETLGLDVGTVKAHMARALAKLRGELRDLYECAM